MVGTSIGAENAEPVLPLFFLFIDSGDDWVVRSSCDVSWTGPCLLGGFPWLSVGTVASFCLH